MSAISLPPGFRLGHAGDVAALTGCTVVLCPPGTRASGDVRGGSPGTRECALLAPEKSMQEIHALLFTGGSAFGLAAADGVMRWLEVHDRGYQTPWGKVPIVPAAVIFDLNVGKTTRPGPDMAYRACESARDTIGEMGNVGAGTGATVGKWGGLERAMKGGFGAASTVVGGVPVTAVAVVNAVGDVVDGKGEVLAGARGGEKGFLSSQRTLNDPHNASPTSTNTTLAAAIIGANFSKLDLYRISQRMHDGMARAVVPVHTSRDGDSTFALSHGDATIDFDVAAEAAAQLTAEAIRNAVRHARSIPGVPGLAG